MRGWDPPQAGDKPEVPLTPVATSGRWWARQYGTVPVWGWLIGGAFATAVFAVAVSADDPGRLASPDAEDAPAVITTPAPAMTEPSLPATSNVISSPAPAPRTTVPATPVATTTVTLGPAPSIVVTMPPTTTTTTRPPQPPPPPPTSATTTPPAPPTIAVLPFIPAPGCDPNHSGQCVPIASDVDCRSGSGNGPAYTDGPVYVVGSDIYGLDHDGDGVACEK